MSVIGLLGYEWIQEIFKPENSLQLIDVVATTLLTAALVYLYFQQKQVLEDQVELTRSELSGNMYVNEFGYHEDSIELSLSNLSGSEISDLVLRTEIFPNEVDGKTLGVSKKALQRADEYETQFGMSAGLAPREQNVIFRGKPAVYYTKEDGSEYIPSLTFFITELRDAGVEEVQCRMWAEGTDQLGQTVKSKVFPWDKTIRVDTSQPVHAEPELEEVFRRSTAGSIDDSVSQF